MKKIDQSVEAYQGGNVYDFDDSLVLHDYPKRIIKKMLKNDDGMEIDKNSLNLLELGLGRGYSTEIFSSVFSDYTILEGDQRIIDHYKEKHPKSNANIVNTYFETFADERKYDVIVMGFVLEHVDDPKYILLKYKEFLNKKGGGRIFISVPNAESMHRQLAYLAGELPDMQKLSDADIELGHKRYFTIETLKGLVKEAGLSIISIEGLFLKPLTTRQMVSLNFSQNYLEAFCKLGKDYPQLCSSILLECKG